MTDTTVHPPRPHPTVETAFLAPEAVLFDDRHGEIHHLNPSASAVWLMVDGELSIEEIAAELSDIFTVPVEQMLPDVEAALADFRARGLLVGSDPELPSDASGSDHSDGAAESDDADDTDLRRLSILARPPDT